MSDCAMVDGGYMRTWSRSGGGLGRGGLRPVGRGRWARQGPGRWLRKQVPSCGVSCCVPSSHPLPSPVCSLCLPGPVTWPVDRDFSPRPQTLWVEPVQRPGDGQGQSLEEGLSAVPWAACPLRTPLPALRPPLQQPLGVCCRGPEVWLVDNAPLSVKGRYGVSGAPPIIP